MRTTRLKTGAYNSKELAKASSAPSFSPYRAKGHTRSIAQVDAHGLPDLYGRRDRGLFRLALDTAPKIRIIGLLEVANFGGFFALHGQQEA
jgi:hypothetical protein